MTKKVISHSRPTISLTQFWQLTKCYFNRHFSLGLKRENLKKLLSAKYSRNVIFTFNSGTVALSVAIKQYIDDLHDEVLLPGFECCSLTTAVKCAGGKPIYYELNDSLCIDYKDLSSKITVKSAVLIFTHVFGNSNNMADIEKFGIPIIEDCSHNWKPHLQDHECIMSVGATKLVNGCEGGIYMSNQLSKQCQTFSFLEKEVFRLSDLHAVLAYFQLTKIKKYADKRRKIAEFYNKKFSVFNIIEIPDLEQYDTIYRYILRFKNKELVDRFIKRCLNERIMCCIAMNPPLEALQLVNTKYLSEHIVSIPIYPSLSIFERKRIVETISNILCDIEEIE